MSLVPQTSASYNLLALTADLVPQFDETRPAHYRLFDIRSVVAPREVAGGLPKFLTPVESVGRVQILDAPGGGYFDVVDVAAWSPANKQNFFDLNSRWLQSDWPERKAYVWLNFRGAAPANVPPLPEADRFRRTAAAPQSSAGTIASERQDGEVYRADLEIARPSFALFKMTWHPNWVAYVDGKAATDGDAVAWIHRRSDDRRAPRVAAAIRAGYVEAVDGARRLAGGGRTGAGGAQRVSGARGAGECGGGARAGSGKYAGSRKGQPSIA